MHLLVTLQQLEELFVSHLLSQLVQEKSTMGVHSLTVGSPTPKVQSRAVHRRILCPPQAIRLFPIVNKVLARLDPFSVLQVDHSSISRQRLVQPWLFHKVVADQSIPPLVCHLVRHEVLVVIKWPLDAFHGLDMNHARELVSPNGYARLNHVKLGERVDSETVNVSLESLGRHL